MKRFWHWRAWGIRAFAGLLLWCGAAVTAAEPKVAGFDELVVYKPGTMDRDIPGIDLVCDPECGWQADIQPTVHVHRYYYNGDKEFQGPLLQGGPTIVSACHPKTGKRLYAQINLPSGAPVIAYNEHTITYVYSDRRVVLTFKGKECGEEVVMTYKPGKGLSRVQRDQRAQRVKKHQQFSDRFPLTRTVKDAAKSVGTTVKGAAGTATEAASTAVTRAKDTFNTLPGIQQLQGLGKEAESRANTESLKQAAEKATDKATEFEKTIR